jgi:hypothetical protein
MKKALTGTILVFSVIAIAAGARLLWLKLRLDDVEQRLAAQLEAQIALNDALGAEPPDANRALRLEESRLQSYLAVRSAVLPAFVQFEQTGRAVAVRFPGGRKSLPGTGLEEERLLAERVLQVHMDYLTALREHRMSPWEFTDITGHIWRSLGARAWGSVEEMADAELLAMQQQVAALRGQLEDRTLSEAQRSALDAQRQALQEQLDAVNWEPEPDSATPEGQMKQVHLANARLLEKYEERFMEMNSQLLDDILVNPSVADALLALEKAPPAR